MMAYFSFSRDTTLNVPAGRPRLRLRDLLSLRRQRADLARLDATRLNDLGLSESAARKEAARPFWDVPDHWCD